MNQIKTTKYFLFLLFFVLISCQRIDKPTILKDNDTIKYYSDFDPFLMKPIGSMNDKAVKYPYCKVQYKKNTDKIMNIVFYHNDGSGAIKKTFLKKGSDYKVITVFNPEPYYNFTEEYADGDKILTFSYNCDEPCDVYNENGGCDKVCWLTAISIAYKHKIKNYYFHDEDSIPKYKVPSLSLNHNNIMKLKSLVGYSFQTITETPKETIKSQKLFNKDYETGIFEENFNVYNTDSCTEYRYNKDSIGFKNWAVYN